MTKDNNSSNKEAEQRAEMQKLQMNLMLQDASLIGANSAMNSYGPEGKVAAENYLNGEEAMEIRKQMQVQEKGLAEKLGIAVMPTMPDNYQLLKNAALAVYGFPEQGSTGAIHSLTLGQLEEVATKVAPGIKPEVAEKLKNMTYIDIHAALQKNKNDETANDALAYHQLLTKTYEGGAAMGIIQNSTFGTINQEFNKLGEKYSPKKEE